jgi:geranylgeranyl transferase type-2 subunit beta
MTSLATNETTADATAVEEKPLPPFYNGLHQKYIRELGEKVESYEYQVTEHLRVSGIYWGFTAMSLLSSKEDMNPKSIVEWVMKGFQYDEATGTGGWGGNFGHDVHMLYTTSAVQILAIAGHLHLLDEDNFKMKNSIVKYIQSLQQDDGSFAGDKWLEIDTRFSYCAMLTLSILNRLDAVNVERSNQFIVSCQNFDGGYGCVPGAESHAGQIFCCVAALSVSTPPPPPNLTTLHKDTEISFFFFFSSNFRLGMVYIL